MKRILGASLASCLALAGPAAAGERCDFGLNEVPGAQIVVRYPREHPTAEGTDRHDNKHIIFLVNPAGVAPGATLGYDDPRIIAVGDFSTASGCELLWEERDPAGPHDAPEDPPIRVAVTEGFLQASSQHFAVGIPRPPLPWAVAGAFDLTGDGRADVLWWNPETGALKLWVRTYLAWREGDVQGALPPANTSGLEGPPFTAIARFEPGRPPGIVWQHPLHDDDAAVLYYPTKWNGEQLILDEVHVVEGLPAGGISIAAVADFDGDGQDDLLERRASDDMILVCLMDGLVVRSSCQRIPPGPIGSEAGPLGWFVAGPR